MDLSFIEPKTLFLIGHLLGIALGVGGALISDLLFMKSIRDARISRTEMDFLMLASHVVTAGLIVLVLSGAGLFSLDPERYLASSKFLAKITVVGVLILNGFIFHLIHIPRLEKFMENRLSAQTFSRGRIFLLGSGVVSLVSWISALVLGAFKSIPFSYEIILIFYGAILAGALFFGWLVLDRLIPVAKSRRDR